MKIRFILLGLLVVVVLIQTVQPDRSNPAVTGPLEAPSEVMSVLRRACYDCHSNETRWPWYSSIAPASWLLSYHVNDGRKHLNFSTWTALDSARRLHAYLEILDVLESGEMPLTSYLLLHRDAVLSDEETLLLVGWAEEGK
jgi:hypothetical protein